MRWWWWWWWLRRSDGMMGRRWLRPPHQSVTQETRRKGKFIFHLYKKGRGNYLYSLDVSFLPFFNDGWFPFFWFLISRGVKKATCLLVIVMPDGRSREPEPRLKPPWQPLFRSLDTIERKTHVRGDRLALRLSSWQWWSIFSLALPFLYLVDSALRTPRFYRSISGSRRVRHFRFQSTTATVVRSCPSLRLYAIITRVYFPDTNFVMSYFKHSAGFIFQFKKRIGGMREIWLPFRVPRIQAAFGR